MVSDQGDNRDEFYLRERLADPNSGDGKAIPFSIPNDGTRIGTVPVTLQFLHRDHVVDAFQSDSEFPNAGTSDTIGVSNAETRINPISTMASTYDNSFFNP
ncbi:hypothetical protein EDD18DRAFT_1111046 [Armillaria luteobubalina]|uniref:Uncharacterized protein n=1 Tax=Armillaria luteobubalina TaxID=153913 RepID=A0AA39PM95_9AGAR|nr:hypothetical protein EDD18DRAFT_1111046 [Armillaria luteobubalina]